jgi:hypothetical protein
MPLGSSLNAALELVRVLGATVTVLIGLASAVALLRGGTGAEIGESAAKGGAVGFLLGVPVALVAEIWLR